MIENNPGKDTWDLKQATEQFQRQLICHALRRTGGNFKTAAKLLGIQRTNLYRKLKALGMKRDDLGLDEEPAPRKNISAFPREEMEIRFQVTSQDNKMGKGAVVRVGQEEFFNALRTAFETPGSIEIAIKSAHFIDTHTETDEKS